MEGINMSKQDIAQAFSTGKFKITFPYLSESIIWEIIGESEINGKSEVISSCEKTSKYFNSVETIFITEDVIIDNNKVVIKGSGEFIKEGKRVNFISACDVYEFNEEHFVERIFSYCIAKRFADS